MSTNLNVILLTGNSPLFQEFKDLIGGSHYQVITIDQLQEYQDRIDLALEVTNTDLAEKKQTIVKLDAELGPSVPIITTSLAVTATEVASWAAHAERICGFGTLVPLSDRELVEVAAALQTDDKVLEQALAFFRSLGKKAVSVQDEVGLVFPRVLSLIVNEAVFTVMEQTAVARDIDTAMKKGTNYPYGPLEWADRIGLDEIYAIMNGLHRDLGEERYRPAPLLRKLVLAKRVGERCGQGFYHYEKQEVGTP